MACTRKKKGIIATIIVCLLIVVIISIIIGVLLTSSAPFKCTQSPPSSNHILISKRITGASGVPRNIGETRNYTLIFNEIEGNFNAFIPMFLYQEVPETLSLGFEVDFIPPCSPTSPPFSIMREKNISLVALGPFLYPPGSPLPPMSDDPLVKLIQCIGRDLLAGVTSHDEPVGTGVALDDVVNLYTRVKEVDPTIPVVMVHSALPYSLGTDDNGNEVLPTDSQIEDFLNQIICYSQFSDAVGVDIYWVPPTLASIANPYSPREQVDYITGTKVYIEWFREKVPDRQYLFVTQAFAFIRQGVVDVGTNEFPSVEHMQTIANITIDEGATILAYWGESFLLAEDYWYWNQVKNVSRAVTLF